MFSSIIIKLSALMEAICLLCLIKNIIRNRMSSGKLTLVEDTQNDFLVVICPLPNIQVAHSIFHAQCFHIVYKMQSY